MKMRQIINFSSGVFLGMLLMFGAAFVDGNTQPEATLPALSRPAPTDWEKDWSAYLAQQMGGLDGNKPGNVLPDGTRYDILTKTTAYEVEWSDKKGESVYQSLHYMLMAERPQAGIIILERGDTEKDLKQLMNVVAYLQGKGVPIHVETINTEQEE